MSGAGRLCLIGLGANLGNPAQQLRWAQSEIGRCFGVPVRSSSLYRSAPIGPPGQPDYCNAVCELWLTERWSPAQVLKLLKQIEAAAGRDFSAPRWSARVLDLDLLILGDLRQSSPDLNVPHPHISERIFVLQPLLELQPELQIPGVGSAAQALARLPDQPLLRWPE